VIIRKYSYDISSLGVNGAVTKISFLRGHELSMWCC
jgi:hypothetical protein